MNKNYSQLVCLSCLDSLFWTHEGGFCNKCDQIYALQETIPVFTHQHDYWCNVAKEKMHELIADAETNQDWLAALLHHIPQYADAVTPFFRADAQYALPLTNESVVLDAGSMWGGLTIPIAQHCKKVYAVDKTWETLRFLDVRSKQMQIDNIVPLVCQLQTLPFPDQFFDFVVVNGVLEWLGMDEQTILENHWQGKYQQKITYNKTPDEMQLQVLKELYRVTKIGGGIYIAIENRIGLQYFLGHPDDHMNVRFVPFLPRALANTLVKKFRGTEYRTYIYTPKQLMHLVEKAGYKTDIIYSVYPHYGKISRLTPFSLFPYVKQLAMSGSANRKAYLLSLVWRLFPGFLAKHLSPSIALVAAKQHVESPPRLLSVLSNHLKEIDIDHYQIMLINNRFNNENTVNYALYHLKNNKFNYFCKISRMKNDTHLINESTLLKKINHLLSQSHLQGSTPQLLACIDEQGLVIQVTRYIVGFTPNTQLLYRLRNIIKLSTNKNWVFICNKMMPIIRKCWLNSVDSIILKAIDWLVHFQKITSNTTSGVLDSIFTWKQNIIAGLSQRDWLNVTIEKQIEELYSTIQCAQETLTFSMQHGDYDICNLIVTDKKNIVISDFEHAQDHCLPFFDLGNLIFSPLISEWKIYGNNQTLADYVKKSAWSNVIHRWVRYYAEKSGTSLNILKHLPSLVALEQNTKNYPSSRDPYSYPMYGQEVLHNMLEWTLDF